MKFFTKFDDQFLQLADDDAWRAAALADLKSKRLSHYLGGMAFIVGNVALELTGHGMAGFSFIGLGFLCVAFKHEADIRTLQMVEHLRKRYDKTAA